MRVVDESLEKTKGPNKYELFGPFCASPEGAALEKFYASADRLRKGFREHSSGSTGLSTDRPDLSTDPHGIFHSGSQNARTMSTAPEGRSGVPSSR